MSNVLRLNSTKATVAPKAKLISKMAQAATRRQRYATAIVSGVGLVLTGLSLTHLASGIGIVTACDKPEAWAMATGIDLGFISLEGALLCATSDKLRARLARFANPAIIGTLVFSAAMNAFAFASNATGWHVYPAVAMGLAIPALLYAMMRTASGMALDH